MRSWTTFRQTQSPNSWDNLQNKPAILSDNQISWDEIQNKPAILSDNQISWDEIQDKPIIESGSFSPKMYGISGKTFYHYKNTGKYIRIDNAYFFSINLEVALSNQNGSEMLQIQDIPFTFPLPQYTPVYIQGTYNNTTNIVTPYLFGEGGFNRIIVAWISSTLHQSFPSRLLANTLRTSGTFYLACNGSFFV